MPRYRVTIVGSDYEAMANLIRRHRIAVVLQTIKKQPGGQGGYSVQALADPDQLQALQEAGYRIERHEDLEETGLRRQAELREAKTRGFEADRAVGRYLDVAEVEARLNALANPPNTGITHLIALPHQTWEGRSCHAIKIGSGTGSGRTGIYLLGGIHAREWGSSDILIHFVDQLTTAYRTQAPLTIGNKRFTAAQIQAIVRDKDIFVFPQANPDGRHHSMTGEAMWRKNRRPATGAGHGAACRGVDINRNFDFLWSYPTHFDPLAPVANSTDPCDHDVYIGPAAASEPETKNVVWLLDQNPGIQYFVDLHSYGELILYNWGDDQDQTGDPAMNFHNIAYDGKRGLGKSRLYGEYIPAADRTLAVSLAKKIQTAIKAVRGRAYKVAQSMTLYPTAGSSDDYAFSRHLADPHATKIHAFTLEWGSDATPNPFHPPYDEMAQIIQEVTAGLLEFCRQAGN